MTVFSNDSPIEDIKNDIYDVAPFAKSIAESILNIENPIGTSIALHGVWGSGKSSVVNLIRRYLEQAPSAKLNITEFKCWWFKGEEAMALAFFQALHATLSTSLGDKAKNLLPKIGKTLLQAGPVIGTAMAFSPAAPIAPLFGKTTDFASKYFSDEESLEKVFGQLSKVLEDQDKRFLVIIDDIDRLTPEETLAIFRLVKSAGQLPNLMFLLVFDRKLAEKIVQERYPAEGPHFLEKIIQVNAEIPAPLQIDLNKQMLLFIDEICPGIEDEKVQNILNYFHDIVAPYLSTPRDVVRSKNAMQFSWPAIRNEINIADFIALEAIRLFEPSLYLAIRKNRDLCLGQKDRRDIDKRDPKRFDLFLQGINENRHETVKLALQRLFPAFEEISYSGYGYAASWDRARRVCIEKHFDTYFRGALSDEALSIAEISEIIERADDMAFIQGKLRIAAQTERRNDQFMVPVYLDALDTRAKEIDKEKVEPLLTGLFQIFDEIDLEKDQTDIFGGSRGSKLQFHWLIRSLTRDRFDIQERTQLYINALQKASLGWLVNFVSSASDNYGNHKEEPKREEDCLVTEKSLPNLKKMALAVIRESAGNGKLLHHKDLVSILYRWRDFMNGEASEVRAWTQERMQSDEALVIFAKQFTGKTSSISMGFSGLGDRVPRYTDRVQIKDDIDILDPALLRTGLEQILKEKTLDQKSLDVVKDFITVWDKQLAHATEA